MAILTVANTNDRGKGSLREAIALANDKDTIVFSPNLKNKTIRLDRQLGINKSLTIDGSDAPNLTLSGEGKTRILRVSYDYSDVTLRNLTFANGSAVDSDKKTTQQGGAIEVRESNTLVVENSQFVNNEGERGGAIFISYGASATIKDSVFDGNDGSSAGDGFSAGAVSTYGGGEGAQVVNGNRDRNVGGEAALNISGTTFTNNKGTYGAVYTLLTNLKVEDSTFKENKGTNGSGAIFTDGANGTEKPDDLGGTTVIRNVVAENNTGGGDYGGAFFLSGYSGDKYIIENTKITNNTASKGAGLAVQSYQDEASPVTLTIRNSTITDNISTSQGGGLWTDVKGGVTIEGSTFSDNRIQNSKNSGIGGAIVLNTAKNVKSTITDTTFTNNSAGDQAGSIWISGQNQAKNLTISNSQFADNRSNGQKTENTVNFEVTNGGGNVVQNINGADAGIPGAALVKNLQIDPAPAPKNDSGAGEKTISPSESDSQPISDSKSNDKSKDNIKSPDKPEPKSKLTSAPEPTPEPEPAPNPITKAPNPKSEPKLAPVTKAPESEPEPKSEPKRLSKPAPESIKETPVSQPEPKTQTTPESLAEPPKSEKSTPSISKPIPAPIEAIPDTTVFSPSAMDAEPKAIVSLPKRPKTEVSPNPLSEADAQPATIGLSLVQSNTDSVSELIVVATDAQGRIQEITPDEAGYKQALLDKAIVDFSTLKTGQLSGLEISRNLALPNDAMLQFALIKNGSLDSLRQSGIGELQLAYPSNERQPIAASTLQEPGLQLTLKVPASSDSSTEVTSIVLESLDSTPPIGSKVQGQSELIDLRGETGTKTATFDVYRNAGYNNLVGFYVVENEQGQVFDNFGNLLNPDDTGYSKAALNNRLTDVNLTGTNGQMESFTAEIKMGQLLASFIVVDGTIEQLTDNIIMNDPDIYFTHLGANSDGIDHIRLLGDNTFGFEDLPGGGDLDYNDVIVKTTII